MENGYPRPTSDPGVASIMRKPDDNSSDIKPVGPNGVCVVCTSVFFDLHILNICMLVTDLHYQSSIRQFIFTLPSLGKEVEITVDLHQSELQ